jgi:hypothetical protein
MPRAGPEEAASSFWCPTAAQQLQQLGDVGGDAPGLVAGEQVRRRSPSRLLREIDVGECLAVVVTDDESRQDRLRPRQAARLCGLGRKRGARSARLCRCPAY